MFLGLEAAAQEPFTVWSYAAYPKWQSLLFDFERESGFRPDPNQRVWAPDCDPSTESKLGRFSLPTQAKVTRGLTASLDFSLDAPTAYIKNYFKLFRFSAVGKEVEARFRPLYEGGRVPILFFSQEKKALSPNASAICECAPGNKRIYVDKFAKAGILASALSHEIVHALDEELEKSKRVRREKTKDLFTRFRALLEVAARRTGRRPERVFLKDVDQAALKPLFALKHRIDQYVHLSHYRAERRAALFENQIVRELGLAFPKFYGKYKLASAPTPKEIRSSYQFKKTYVDRYLAGRCVVPKGAE